MLLDLSKLPPLNVGAGDIPTLTELMSLYSRCPDYESQELFIQSHFWTLAFIVQSWQLPLQLEHFQLEEALCDRVGFSYPQVRTASIRRQYYICRYSRQVVNPRIAHELASENKLFPGAANCEKLWIAEDQRLRSQFNFYAQASVIWDNYRRSCDQMASHDRVTAALLKELLLLQIEISKLDYRQLESTGKTEFTLVECPHCGKYFQVKRKPGRAIAPPHCGSGDCLKSYERQKKRVQRQLNPVSWQATSTLRRKFR